METLITGLTSRKYTTVKHECKEDMKYNAPHQFIISVSPGHPDAGKMISHIHFQEGPIKECGINGVMNEDLIAAVIKRLECFQESEFKCRENALAITKLEEALMWLRKRTIDREARNVEGTNKV